MGAQDREEEEEEENRRLGEASDPSAMASLPGAYASLIYKQNKWISSKKEYVVTFMGTKTMTEPSMMFYNMQQQPTLFEFTPTPGNNLYVLTTYGYALYVMDLLPCLFDMVQNTKLNYITGHSLGGAAASIFATLLHLDGSLVDPMGDTTQLVTFGAPPMKMKTYDVTKVSGFDPSDASLTETCTKCGGYNPNWSVPTSVRFFHKFDPIPSDYLWGGKWEHNTAQAFLLYDEHGCTSASASGVKKDPSVATQYWFSAGVMAANEVKPLGDLYSFLCTTKGTYINQKKISGADAAQWYSYTNMLNPMPCLEVVYAMTYSFIVNQLPIGGIYADLPMPWTPQEDFAECTFSYTATLDAYFETYLSAILAESRGIYEPSYWAGMSDEEVFVAIAQIAGFYGAWGLSWVHSTYPNYKLGANFGDYGEDYYEDGAAGQITWSDINDKLPAFMKGNTALKSLTGSYSGYQTRYNTAEDLEELLAGLEFK